MTFIATLPLLIFVVISFKVHEWLFMLADWLDIKAMKKPKLCLGPLSMATGGMAFGVLGCFFFSLLCYITWYAGDYLTDPNSFIWVFFKLVNISLIGL